MQFSKKEIKILKKFSTPAKVQDFLNALPFNFERDGKDTIKSPLRVLREGNAHCLEGAIFAAYVFSLHKRQPLILHLKTTKGDFDHCIAPFQEGKYWGAVSKTNHNVLRYREPVYSDIRELVMSYFHEYFLDSGKKTLRAYSKPLNLKKIKKGWETSEHDLWEIDSALDRMKHYDILPKDYISKLRKADRIEIESSKREEYKRKTPR